MAISKIQDAGVSLTVDAITATGTPDATTFLRGDGTWGTVDTTPPTGLGEIGTNIIGIKDGYYSGGLSFDFGTTYSSVYVARPHAASSWSLMPGTWRALGGTQGFFAGINSNQHLGLFVRVS